MTVSLYNCWNCDKELKDKVLSNKKELVDLFFYCDSKCKAEHEKKTEASTRPYHQWSAYIAGEREKPPRQLAHLTEKWGRSEDKKAVVTSDDDNSEAEEKPTGRRCGKCGEVGHNARTCGRKKAAPKRQKRKGKPRKSPQKAPGAPQKTRAKKGRKPKKRRTTKRSRQRQYTCSRCQQKGHNARTCGKND